MIQRHMTILQPAYARASILSDLSLLVLMCRSRGSL